MNLPTLAPPDRSSWFPWAVRLAWVAVYLSCMNMADWDFSGPVERAQEMGAGFAAWFLFGAPGDAITTLHGAAVPSTMGKGAWHRLFLDGWIEPSLLGLLFTLWIWSSLGGRLYQIAGVARSWIVLVLGSVAAAGAHVVMNPSSQFGGAGSGGTFYAALGALTVFAFANTSPIAKAMRKTVISYIVMFVVLTVAFSLLQSGDLSLGLIAWPSMAGGFIAGVLAMLSMGPTTVLDAPPGVLAKASALFLLAVLLMAASTQAPAILEGPGRIERVQTLQDKVMAVERAAWRARDPRRATPEKRQAVADAIAAVRGIEWVETWEGMPVLDAWIECFEPYATGNMPDPDGHVRIVMKAAWAQYLPVESRLLREVGITPRKDTWWIDRF